MYLPVFFPYRRENLVTLSPRFKFGLLCLYNLFNFMFFLKARKKGFQVKSESNELFSVCAQ